MLPVEMMTPEELMEVCLNIGMTLVTESENSESESEKSESESEKSESEKSESEESE